MIRSVLISLLLALAVAAWIFSGTFGADPRADAANTPTAENASLKIEPVLVRTRSMTAEHHVRDVVLRGRTEAKRWVDVQAETGGRLVSILVQKGDSVREGQVLVRIDMDDREARLAEALARVNQRQLEYDAAEQLNERGYRSDTKLAAAAAELDRAIASQTQVEIDIANTEVRAPFGGRVEERDAELGYVVGAGSTVARIVDQDPYLLVGHVSERDVHLIHVGDPAQASLINEQTVEGKVSFVATTANPQTRTFRVEIVVPNRDGTLRDGLTSEIRIPVESRMAHLVSPSILTLNDDGELGVRMVVNGDRVQFTQIEIVGDGPDGLWLTGLPGIAEVIVVGQDFVRDGDRVRVSNEDAPAS